MALVAFNLTATPDLPLAAGKPTPPTLDAGAPPEPGPPLDVSSELQPDLTVDPINGVAGGLDAAAFTLLEAQRAAGDVDFVWDGPPEFKTGTLTVGGQPLTADQTAALDAASPALDANNPPLTEKDERILKFSTQANEYFVDTATGDDSNSGLSGSPWKTLNRAIAVLRRIVFEHPFVLHAPGAHVLSANEAMFFKIFKRAGCIVDGGPNVTVILDNAGSPFMGDISTANSIGWSGLALTPDQYEGYDLRIYSGPAAGIWKVRTHDGTTFIPTAKGGFPAPPGSVQFDLVQPESTIDVTGTPFSFDAHTKAGMIGVEGDGALWVQRFTFTGNMPVMLSSLGGKPTINLSACVIDKGVQLVSGNLWRWSFFHFKGDGGFVGTPRDPSVMGAGTALADNFAGVGVVGGPGSIFFFDGLVEWSNGLIDFFDSVSQQVTINASPGVGFRIREGSKVSAEIANTAVDLVTPWYDCFLKGFIPFGVGFPTKAGIWAVSSTVTLGEVGKGPVDCSNGVSGIYARDSKIRIDDGITGTGNTNHGIDAVDGTEIYFEDAAAIAAMTLTGADGEVSLDGEIEVEGGFAAANGADVYEPKTSCVMRVQSRTGQ